jgi:hypothetical protein
VLAALHGLKVNNTISMSRFLAKVATVIVLLPILSIGGCVGYRFYQGRRFGHLEANARKVITPQELQAWALKLISDSHSYSNSQQVRTIRTNYPPQLGSLVPGPEPDVTINDPESVSLIWGSGFWGHKGFIVGSTNFEFGGEAWAPGIYFFQH